MMKSHGGLCCGHSRGKTPLLEPGWTHAVGPMVSPPHPRSGEKPWPPGRGSCLDVAPAPTPHLDQPVLLLTFPLCCLHSSRESLTESVTGGVLLCGNRATTCTIVQETDFTVSPSLLPRMGLQRGTELPRRKTTFPCLAVGGEGVTDSGQ